MFSLSDIQNWTYEKIYGKFEPKSKKHKDTVINEVSNNFNKPIDNAETVQHVDSNSPLLHNPNVPGMPDGSKGQSTTSAAVDTVEIKPETQNDSRPTSP